MTVLERTNLKRINLEKDSSEREETENGYPVQEEVQMTILKRNTLKQDKFEKDKSETILFWNGTRAILKMRKLEIKILEREHLTNDND